MRHATVVVQRVLSQLREDCSGRISRTALDHRAEASVQRLELLLVALVAALCRLPAKVRAALAGLDPALITSRFGDGWNRLRSGLRGLPVHPSTRLRESIPRRSARLAPLRFELARGGRFRPRRVLAAQAHRIQAASAAEAPVRTPGEPGIASDMVAAEPAAPSPMTGPAPDPTASSPAVETSPAKAVMPASPFRFGARERWLASGLAVLIVGASMVSVAPPPPTAGATGGTNGYGTGARIAIGGVDGGVLGAAFGLADLGAGNVPASSAGSVSATTFGLADIGAGNVPAGDHTTTSGDAAPAGAADTRLLAEGMAMTRTGSDAQAPVGNFVNGTMGAATATSGNAPQLAALADQLQPVEAPPSAYLPGPFLADGTLLKPLAVDTTVPDGKAILKKYRVKSGDTLEAIAKSFHLTSATLWSSNWQLSSPSELKVGQTLLIPPVNGVVHIVQDGETLKAIAARTKVAESAILKVNHLSDSTLYIGQTLVIPGASQRPYPKAKPAPALTASTSSSSRSSSSRSSSHASAPQYTGGKLVWPVPGGWISQYFHYGHPALDIAAAYGHPVVAAAAGTVTFAGWKNNGGGYQVWISHGNNLYTTYNHMSAVTVGVGQVVAAGQQVGRIGMTGNATGPHCHFEVWIGPIWAGGYRVNPLNYF